MSSRQPRNVAHPIRGGHGSTFPSPPPPAVSLSPYAVDQLLLVPAPHLPSFLPLQLQPPPAPRLRNVPLPELGSRQDHPYAPPTRQDAFPVDLTSEVDFEILARSMPNYSIAPHTKIFILPASRDGVLMELNTGDRSSSTFSVIRLLQAVMRAPLSLQTYHDLEAPAQQSVRSYFLLRSGRHGARLWQGFLHGSRHPQGPSGAVMLRGKFYMWGFSPDHRGRWVLDVDALFPPGL
ncbi:hypothetical protein C8R44DRAFT_974171 [Mycena epipterygia]|nr:hypothetical protein C8R44DRAFT_974171 [Mycena epipterygia]